MEKIDTVEQFYSLKKSWNDLLEKSTSESIFLTWEWLYTWWETYSKGKELCILVFHDDRGKLISIAPFYFTYEKIWGIPIKVLKLIGSEEVCSEYLDVIVKKDRIKETTKELVLFLKDHLEWDIFLIRDISEHCFLNDVLREMKDEDNIIFTDTVKTINPFISLPEKEELFTASLSHNKRSAIKRKEKKLVREHGFSIFSIDNGKDLTDYFRDFVALHQKLWKNRGYPGMFKRKSFLRFHESVARRFLENNWLRLYFLSVQGKPVASLYGFQDKDKFYYYQSGFDPAWRVYGVGTILIYHTIIEAVRTGLKEYDFLRGEADYKFDFTSTFRHTREILVRRNTYKANFYKLHKIIRRQSKDAVKWFLPEKIVSQARKIKDHIVLR